MKFYPKNLQSTDYAKLIPIGLCSLSKGSIRPLCRSLFLVTAKLNKALQLENSRAKSSVIGCLAHMIGFSSWFADCDFFSVHDE